MKRHHMEKKRKERQASQSIHPCWARLGMWAVLWQVSCPGNKNPLEGDDSILSVPLVFMNH